MRLLKFLFARGVKFWSQKITNAWSKLFLLRELFILIFVFATSICRPASSVGRAWDS